MAMIEEPQYSLERCPYCNVHMPMLSAASGSLVTKSHDGQGARIWRLFACQTCGGVVLAHAKPNKVIAGHIPGDIALSEDIPSRAREFLKQAIETKHAPSASIVVAASSVDAMLKERGLVKGSLFNRIDKAAANHTITGEMREWAHDIRLDANDQRHAELTAALPTTADAERVIEFALALAQYLFVLPARVTRGKAQAAAPVAQAQPPK